MDVRLEARLRADPTGDPRHVPGQFRDRIAGAAVVNLRRQRAVSNLRPLGTLLAIAVVLAAALLLRPVITEPAATPSPVPSATGPIGVPTPEPTVGTGPTTVPTPDRLSIAGLIATPHTDVTAKQMQSAVQAALAADPSPWPADLTADSKTCETGIDPDPSLAFANGPLARNTACQLLLTDLYGHYWSSGIQQDYDAMASVYEYTIAQPIGYPDATGPQPSDSAVKERQDLDTFLLSIDWSTPGTARF